MSESTVELLFFDTFAHDNSEDINLDLVQFPKPVNVTEVRIIPLGARVQADFPGGVRLGATNPSQFNIEFFVNDLGKPGASTFETLGAFQYDQNGKINLECTPDETVRKIPTDGLVLRGVYTTITLAVYGTLTNNLAEQLIQPIVNPSISNQPNTIADAQQIVPASTLESEWSQETIAPQPIAEYPNQATANFQNYGHPPENNYQHPPDYTEYYDRPKDPRSYHHTPETEWDKGSRSRDSDRERSRDAYQDREHLDRRERRFSRSKSRDRERSTKDYHESNRDRENYDRDRDRDRSDYRSDRDNRDYDREGERDRDRTHDRDRDRDRGRDRRHDDSYRRSERYRDEREDRKRPRTPPVHSPKRPHSPPHSEATNEVHSPPVKPDHSAEDVVEKAGKEPREERSDKTPEKSDDNKDSKTNVQEEGNATTTMDVEEFEPILSDEDILDDGDHYQESDFDFTTYTNNDDIVRQFVPGVAELQKYPTPKKFVIQDNGDVKVDENLKNSIAIADDYLKSSITKYELNSFGQLNTEIKEEFVHLAEKLMVTIGEPEVFMDIMEVFNTITQSTLALNQKGQEITVQVTFIVETVTEWLKIALHYGIANSQDQPAYKTRHIKCGVRLAEWLSYAGAYLQYLWDKSHYNLHKVLLGLFHQEYMALSIKLLILKALDTYLLHKFCIEKFLLGSSESKPSIQNGYLEATPLGETNGYKVLVEALQKKPLVRERFALSSILKKLNLFEILNKMHNILIKLRNASNDISAEEINLITKTLNQILNYCNSGPFTMSQPRRFLPVAAQFEIARRDSRNVLVFYFKMFHLLQCFVLLLTYPSTLNLPAIKTPIFQIISSLLDSAQGLQYLSENCPTINLLLKCLLRPEDEELHYNLNDCVEVHNLGLKVAYKVQALYHVECLKHIGVKHKFDFEAVEVIEELHQLFCLTFPPIGKFAVGEVLAQSDNVQCLFQFLDNANWRSESTVQKLAQSPAAAYIVDLIHATVVPASHVQFLEKYAQKIKEVLHVLHDASASPKVNELRSYVDQMPAGGLTYDNVAPFLSCVERHIETAVVKPESLVTSLRILQHLGISTHEHGSPLIGENPIDNFVELKYKHVILQLFSADGVTILVRLLNKLCGHFEQPALHSSIFASSNQGLALVNVIQPALVLLKKMLGYVIQCRSTQFNDLTAVPVLLKTYNLLNSFPVNCAASASAQKCKSVIVDTLLEYTQPLSEEKDSLNKTLWSQMLGEVIRFVTTAPYTFVAGLLILSELLPLPLPIHGDDLSEDEVSWLINLRKLWAAHLHPHTATLQDTINKLCVSAQPQLLNLLRRICVQVADLAASSALMIARGFLDTVCQALKSGEENPTGSSGHLARLLNFLACLVTHNTIKCATLHLVHTNATVGGAKSDEKYSQIVGAFCRILKLSSNATSHVQTQECVLSIVQSFCDVEITLMQRNVASSETYLAHALPGKEHLVHLIGAVLDHLRGENSFVTYLPAVRTMLLLTEHDYGFFHLKEGLLKREQLFSGLLGKLVKHFSKTNAECLSTLNTLVEFLRICMTTEENDNSLLYSPRTFKLSATDVKSLIGWPDAGTEEAMKHPFLELEEMLKKLAEEDGNFETILEGLSLFLKQLQTSDQLETSKASQEVLIPSGEPLLSQYSHRIICSSSDACDERLTSRYWLAVPAEETEGELETISCDLFEICRQLPPEFNLIKEVEKLCRISRTDPPTSDKTKDNDEQRLKARKPFITPMRPRGFPRTAPQRPDLFRSRPPNTSRPPSLHVDDFVALETCGAQPTGPTGYNKLSREILASTRMARGARGRAFITSERSMHYNRQLPWWGAPIGRGPSYF